MKGFSSFAHRVRSRPILLALSVGVAACSDGESPEGSEAVAGTSGANGATDPATSSNTNTNTTGAPTDHSALASCTQGLSDEDIAGELEISVALHDSIHELVACGGMTVTIVTTLVSGIVQAIIAGASSFEPDGVRYAGEGRYVSETGSDGDGELSVTFSYDAGEGPVLIEENLFAVASYLQGVSVASGLDGFEPFVELSFTAPGPWVQLLGFGANPGSPIRLAGDDATSLQPDLSDLWVTSNVTVNDAQGHSVVHYEVATETLPFADVVSRGVFAYDLLDISADNSNTSQQAVADELSWDIGFGQAALTGSASFTIVGGAFDYGLYYGHSADHSDDIVLSCLE